LGRCDASTSIGLYSGTKAISRGSSRLTTPITTNTGATAGWPELRRPNAVAYLHRQSQNLSHIPGGNIATAFFTSQSPPELEFDTDRSIGWEKARVSQNGDPSFLFGGQYPIPNLFAFCDRLYVLYSSPSSVSCSTPTSDGRIYFPRRVFNSTCKSR
jgi:hypothetical protein